MAIPPITWIKDTTPLFSWDSPTLAGIQIVPGFFHTYEDLAVPVNDYFHTNDKAFGKTIIWESS